MLRFIKRFYYKFLYPSLAMVWFSKYGPGNIVMQKERKKWLK